MSEYEALRAYFDAHREMANAIKVETFAVARVKANQAEQVLVQLAAAASRTGDAAT